MTTTIDPDNGITTQDLALAARKNAVREFHIDQSAPNVWCVRVRLNWRDEYLYLITRRARTQPRCFKDFNRLIQHIEAHYPKITDIQLHLSPKLDK